MLGLDPVRLRALFITHTHPDHIYGLPSLIHSMMLEEAVLPVYGSRESLKFAAKLLDLFGLRREKIKYRVEFMPLAADDAFTPATGMKSRALPVRHKSSSLGLHIRVERVNTDFVYTGDTAVCPDLFKRFFGTDYLVHDCSVPSRFFRLHPDLPELHTQSLDLGRLAEHAGIRCLVPVHFFGEADFKIEEMEQEIRKHFKGALFIPNDMDQLMLKAGGRDEG